MRIIGITGTIGAGKGTIVDYLCKHHGFSHYSVREYLLQIIRERGLPGNRDSMVQVANELRARHSPGFIIEELYRQAGENGRDCIIESIRTPGEVDALRARKNFILIAVDADDKVRYERILARESETDRISYDTFKRNEQREMHSTDPNKQNISHCIGLSHFRLTNDGSFDELFQKVEALMQQIKPKQYV